MGLREPMSHISNRESGLELDLEEEDLDLLDLVEGLGEGLGEGFKFSFFFAGETKSLSLLFSGVITGVNCFNAGICVVA